MATFQKFKTRKNGFTSYRQAGSSASVMFPRSAFEGGNAPDFLEIDGPLAAPGSKAAVARAVDPEVLAARQVIENARAARKAALEAKLAGLTPEQRAKREANLAKLKAKAAAKKAAA